jgi:hypothetical protein
VLDAKALQSAEIITVAEISEELFEDRPVTVAAGSAEFMFKVALQVVLDMVVVE